MNASARGNALGGTLLVMILLFIFGLTLANMATFDLRLVNRTGERQMAREAAEAGLNHVIALIGQDPTVGTNDEVFQQTLPNGSSYRVSFDPDHDDWSLNNLRSLGVTPRAPNRQVPPHHVLLFSQGTSKAGEVALIESLMRLEAFPYAIAGTNKVRANSVTVLGASTADKAQAGETTLIGSTYSGSDEADSTTITGLSNISGDVRSVGGATVSGTVMGDIESDVDPEQLPDLQIDRFTTKDTPRAQLDEREAGEQSIPVLTGFVYIKGPAQFPLGATLVNATVYVKGNFDATALAGTGTLFVNGETRITTGLTMSGPGRLTLFSDGDITLGAGGVFQGVFLTNGNFVSNGVLRVLGAIYASNEGDLTAGNVTLTGGGVLSSLVIHVEEYTAFASYWLGLGGGAKPVQVYWNQLR